VNNSGCLYVFGPFVGAFDSSQRGQRSHVHRATGLAHKKKGSCRFLYDYYTCECTSKEAARVVKTCVFLQIMTHLPELTQIDIWGACGPIRFR